jgi:hypothetical protein
VAVAADPPDALRRLRAGASMEDGHVVAGPLQEGDDKAADESGAADDEDAHRR